MAGIKSNGVDPNPAADVIEYPAEYGIKVMGETGTELITQVKQILRDRLNDNRDVVYTTRASRNGRYISLTCTFLANSRKELDDIYVAMRACPNVLMAL